jgi:hypothetical protein
MFCKRTFITGHGVFERRQVLAENPPNGEGHRFYTADSMSEAEILILLGYLPGEDNDKDHSLFPTPKTFEEHSNHYRGMVGVGAAQLIKNMLKKAECNPKWLTEAQWKAYLRPNNFGSYAPTHVPSIKDFDLVGEKIRHMFPINWQHIPLHQIRIPECFDPRATRN